MIIFLQAATFLLGIHLMMMMLVCTYRFIDLWYCIDEIWRPLTFKLGLWFGASILIPYWLPESFQSIFHAGFFGYLTFHIVIFWFGRLILAIAQD